VLVSLQACDKTRHDASVGSDASTTAAALEAVVADDGDGGVSEKASRGPRLVLPLAAASFVASVIDIPAWPESDGGARRLGYLRNGAVVNAYDPPIKNDDCKDGWYELVGGGYVCGKAATIDLTSPRVKLAPKQPDLDAGMPYRYGANVADGTPVYRRVLNAEDRRKYESWVATGPKPEDKERPEEKAEEKKEIVEGEKDEEPGLVSSEEEQPPPRRNRRDKSASRESTRERDRNKDPFRDRADGGRPTLKQLKGRGVLVRRMARGFIVALDRDFKAADARWWRTTFGFAVPYDRIVPMPSRTSHRGSWFVGEAAVVDPLPFPELAANGDAGELAAIDAGASMAGAVAFVTSSGVPKVEVTEDGRGGYKVTGWAGELPRRSAVLLTGREAKVAGVTYHQTSGGFWVNLAQLRMAKPSIPDDVGPDEKWIDVDLTRQQLVAFEGRRPVFATLISSGRRDPYDKDHDFPTPTGIFRIREKHVTSTMDGDVASDGPYSIEDVPWVMYFQGSYALHGAFWHDAFGNTRSHGCVNLSPEDARTLFHWAEPVLPAGWHGVFSKDENTGSRVVVHEDPPPKRR
jgi:lipoprotein-anchoring transpeptidase ErfK/SrfK